MHGRTGSLVTLTGIPRGFLLVFADRDKRDDSDKCKQHSNDCRHQDLSHGAPPFSHFPKKYFAINVPALQRVAYTTHGKHQTWIASSLSLLAMMNFFIKLVLDLWFLTLQDRAASAA
ncbi:MAG: hypothetical protein LBD12_04605 [Clostridiales Family XIII bacterium]|jgi:hypothetical protein|nr:hypothetical protein [Clostridiales Family XIII bacterium]